MSGYFAPAFLSYILGKCLRRKSPILLVLKLGIAIIVTIVSLKYRDYIFSPNDRTYMNGNLAPFERGIYKDYIAYLVHKFFSH
ncbi:BnaA04g27900D [Brassica napus]|uniref:(rape) hypothetical protein n=1 Tax=Brassica napus TaxID=3708 RepID=A0A078IRE9_BRANA|nr:unnamed protein product [Brassica napus]CDY52466.1 BnaA04g27900D [Brassica napus]